MAERQLPHLGHGRPLAGIEANALFTEMSSTVWEIHETDRSLNITTVFMGVCINKTGHILTASGHVDVDEERFSYEVIGLNGDRKLPASVVDLDETSGLALLQIKENGDVRHDADYAVVSQTHPLMGEPIHSIGRVGRIPFLFMTGAVASPANARFSGCPYRAFVDVCEYTDSVLDPNLQLLQMSGFDFPWGDRQLLGAPIFNQTGAIIGIIVLKLEHPPYSPFHFAVAKDHIQEFIRPYI